MKTFYVVKNQHGQFLAGSYRFIDEPCHASIVTLSIAKRKCTYIINRFYIYGVVPTIVEVEITEKPASAVEYEIVCPRCQNKVVPVAHQIPNQNRSVNWRPNVYVAICPVCKNELEIKK